ncbi:MAG TPA: hypothetical protein VNT26_12800 [Candidatus Sulfotelmatobacter sp.]|nr:hypothetical protein [Candidatus Sulfotelmatobacter sp.]
MAATLTVRDETTSGQTTHTLTLDGLTERLTVRELIRARIYQEVQDYNQGVSEYFRGLVAPTEAECTEKGYKLRQHRKIDCEQQYQRALEAFEHKGFLVLVGDQQAQSLDQEFDIQVDTEVSFIKTMPLVGG